MNLSVVVFYCLAVLVSTDDGWRSRYVRRGPAWRPGGNIMQTPFVSSIRRQFGAIGPKVISGRTSARGAMILRKRLQDRVRSIISKNRGPMKSFYGMSTPQRSPPRFPVQLPNLVKPNVERSNPEPIWQRVLKMIFGKGDVIDGPGSFGRRGVDDRDIPGTFGRLGDVVRNRPGLFGRRGDSNRDRSGPFGRRGDGDRDRPEPFGQRGDNVRDRPGPFGRRNDGDRDRPGPFGRPGDGGKPMILRKRLQDRVKSLISKDRGPMKSFYGKSTPQRSPPRFPVQLPNLFKPNVDRSKPEPIWQRVLKMIFGKGDDIHGPGSFARRGVDDRDISGTFGRLGDVVRDRPGLFGRRGDSNRDRPGPFGRRGDFDRDRPGPFEQRGDNDRDRPGPIGRRSDGDRDGPRPFGRRGDGDKDTSGTFGRRGYGERERSGPFGRRGDSDIDIPGTFRRRGDGDRDRPGPFGRSFERRDGGDSDGPGPFASRGDGDRIRPGSYRRLGNDGDRPRPYGGHMAVDNSGVPEFYRRRWGSGLDSNRLIDMKIGNPVQKLMMEIAKIFTGQDKDEDSKPNYQPNSDRKESYDKKESSNHFKNVMVKVIKMMQEVLGKDMPVNVNDDKICKKKCQAKSKCFGKQDVVKMMMVAPKPCKSCVMKACDSKMDRQCFLDAHMTCDDVCPKISPDKVKDKAESCKVCMNLCEAEDNDEDEENLNVDVTNDDVEGGSIVDDGNNDGTWPEMEDDDVEDDGGIDLDDISLTGDMM